MNTMQINPALTIEDFGDEIIIVNLHNGAYFSMKGAAAVVWKNLMQTTDLAHLLEQLSTAYDLDSDALKGVRQFMEQCAEDELFVLSNGEFSHFDTFQPSQSELPPLQKPAYEKFTNMQDILLLDPIHDVGELGWPHRKA